MSLPPDLLVTLEAAVGPEFVLTDLAVLEAHSVDGQRRGARLPDAVVRPGTADEVSRVLVACSGARVPVVPRGGGTGYSGGAVPTRGGIVLAMDRFDRIIDIDEESLLAVVQPNVVTGVLQAEVERRGLFYPPDPASLDRSALGGNVAECAGGPRAFKYGTTRHYVLGLQAVLPTGEIIRTGGRTVKNVVGYDLTQLLIGSEGTLAVVTEIVLRLLPKPPAVATLRATFTSVRDAANAVTRIVRERTVPAALELVDRASLDAVAAHLDDRSLAPPGTGALLLIEVDGMDLSIDEEAARVARACLEAGATDVERARTEDERQRLWRARRELSPALKTLSLTKLNHDVVVPKGLVPRLFDLVAELSAEHDLLIPCFGHAGDGNIHVNIMADPDRPGQMEHARLAERRLLQGVVALGGSISGEHGIGFTKAPFLALELAPEVIALMRRIKRAFDPHDILNPGKIFPEPSDPQEPALQA